MNLHHTQRYPVDAPSSDDGEGLLCTLVEGEALNLLEGHGTTVAGRNHLLVGVPDGSLPARGLVLTEEYVWGEKTGYESMETQKRW